MSFTMSRGRHRAPGKLATSLNSTARVSVAVAATGGIAAALAVPQSASASSVPTTVQAGSVSADALNVSAAGAKQSVSISSDLKTVLASVAVAKPQLGTVQAKDLVVRAQRSVAASQDTADSQQSANATTTRRASQASTSRSATRTSVANTARSTSSSSNTSGSVQSGASTGGVVRSGAVGIAMNYLGVPYVFGGTTPAGFDCSGLTGYVYQQMGISLPRTAAAQQASLRSVSNPQPGDLVFFGYPAYHVGIYAGNGMMIAAPSPGSVVRLQKIWNTPSGYGRP